MNAVVSYYKDGYRYWAATPSASVVQYNNPCCVVSPTLAVHWWGWRNVHDRDKFVLLNEDAELIADQFMQDLVRANDQ